MGEAKRRRAAGRPPGAVSAVELQAELNRLNTLAIRAKYEQLCLELDDPVQAACILFDGVVMDGEGTEADPVRILIPKR